MKIINLTEFRKMPEGTIYSHYEPCIFSGLLIKGETLPVDYACQDLIGNIESESSEHFADMCFLAEEAGESINLDFDCYGRDGMFEENQLYAIYENKDILGLIECLKQGLK